MKINLGGRNIWVNFHHLYCFWIIAEEGQVARAASRLGIGSSALSIQMKQFEAQLGHALFDRSHRSLQLNEQGKLVKDFAQSIFQMGREMVETLYDRPGHERYHAQIGCLDSVPKHLTVELVEAAIRENDCSLTLVEGRMDDLLLDLTQHRLDMIVSNYIPAVSEPGVIQSRRVARLPLTWVGAKKFRSLKRGFPDSLEGQPMILPTSESRVRQAADDFFKEHGLRCNLLAEAQDLMVQKLLAVRGLGLTLAPEFAVRDFLRSGDLYRIGVLPQGAEELYFIASKRQRENPVAARLFRGFELRA